MKTEITKTQAAEIANTIAQQMGGTGRLRVMVNAKHLGFDGDGSLSFSFMKGSKKVNHVRISLDFATDTYTMQFAWRWSTSFKKSEPIHGLYFDQLIPIFEETTQLALTI